ncbi:MAG TPA: hypothetical protein VFI45_06530 [Candidatus Acidoferrum sp.]|nr:hypothetical protein [Candidatus Acidoferrum sp.]
MIPRTISRAALFFFLIASIAAAADKTPPAYQKGTISNVSGNHASCELTGADIHKLIGNCGDFQSGQPVDYRVQGDKVYIRHEGGKEYKCAIVGTIETNVAGKTTYQQGTIKGWEKGTDFTSWIGPRGETIPRDKTVYELNGPGTVYLIAYCGSFQAGKFSLGQTVNYRVDETDKDDRRLYITHDNGKEYNCKIEGQKMLEPGKNDMPSTASSSATRHLNP